MGGHRERVQQNGASLLAKSCKLDRRPLDEGPRPRRDKARCLLHDIILEGDTTLFLSNDCGFPFGVTCCYNTFNDIIIFYQLSYIIFFGVHTHYLCYLD